MTEVEWDSSNDPLKMLAFLFLINRASQRKLRLFACACCRHIWHLLPDEQSRWALEICERFADGLSNLVALQAAREAAISSFNQFSDYDENDNFRGWESASAAVAGACWTGIEGCEAGLFDVIDNTFGLSPLFTNKLNGQQIETMRQCHLIRDIFGNPYHPVTCNPTWMVPNVVNIAKDIYFNRSFKFMEILGNTLEDFGCNNMQILLHCRSNAEHDKGCWLLDSILKKY